MTLPATGKPEGRLSCHHSVKELGELAAPLGSDGQHIEACRHHVNMLLLFYSLSSHHGFIHTPRLMQRPCAWHRIVMLLPLALHRIVMGSQWPASLPYPCPLMRPCRLSSLPVHRASKCNDNWPHDRPSPSPRRSEGRGLNLYGSIGGATAAGSGSQNFFRQEEDSRKAGQSDRKNRAKTQHLVLVQ